jgi:hypothetical protein
VNRFSRGRDRTRAQECAQKWRRHVRGGEARGDTRTLPAPRAGPLRGHPGHLKRLDEPGAHETLKQLARLGEAFVISDEGVALSVVYLPGAPSSKTDGSPASISRLTGAAAVVVSEDSVVRVFDDGRPVREISPGCERDPRRMEIPVIPAGTGFTQCPSLLTKKIVASAPEVLPAIRSYAEVNGPSPLTVQCGRHPVHSRLSSLLTVLAAPGDSSRVPGLGHGLPLRFGGRSSLVACYHPERTRLLQEAVFR